VEDTESSINASKEGFDRSRLTRLHSVGMKRFAAIGITAVLLWALVPGVGEVFENAAHFVKEGHFAHAAPDGDEHQPSGPEHGCAGTLHLCSCCVTLSFLLAQTVAQGPNLGPKQLAVRYHAQLPTISASGIYHPPRA